MRDFVGGGQWAVAVAGWHRAVAVGSLTNECPGKIVPLPAYCNFTVP